MYRIVILAAGFLVALGGLLFLQGGERDPRDLAADPGLDAVAVTGVETMSAPRVTPQAAGSDLDMSALSAAVSASVAPVPTPTPTPTPEADAMRQVTAAVLASLGGAGAPASSRTGGDLETLIAQSMARGQSDAYVEALLSEAVTTGGLQVPEAMMTPDGRLDTRTLLASIVARSTGTSDAEIDALRAEAVAGGHLTAPAGATTQARSYVVEEGDSLAYIALIFYKDAGQYDRIFEANRDRLESPAMIRVGQRLRIPG